MEKVDLMQCLLYTEAVIRVFKKCEGLDTVLEKAGKSPAVLKAAKKVIKPIAFLNSQMKEATEEVLQIEDILDYAIIGLHIMMKGKEKSLNQTIRENL